MPPTANHFQRDGRLVLFQRKVLFSQESPLNDFALQTTHKPISQCFFKIVSEVALFRELV